jgi:CRP/FNR family transcriptional regulator
MNELSTAEVLASVDAFRGLEDAHCQLLADKFQRRRYASGERILQEGERIELFSVIVDGSVDIVLPENSREIHRFSELRLGTLGPGEHIGEYALLDMRPASASAIASTETTLLQIDTHDLQHLLYQHCEIARTVYFNLALLLVDRLRRANQELDLVSLD